MKKEHKLKRIIENIVKQKINEVAPLIAAAAPELMGATAATSAGTAAGVETAAATSAETASAATASDTAAMDTAMNTMDTVSALSNDNQNEGKLRRHVILKESKLRQYILETVKNVLSELDWRTYASAYDKAQQNGDVRRANKFRQASTNAFNRKHGYGLDRGQIPYGYNEPDYNKMIPANKNVYYGDFTHTNNGEQFTSGSGKVNANGDGFDQVNSYQGVNRYDSSNRMKNQSYKRGDVSNNANNGNTKQRMSMNPSMKMAQMKGDKEVRDFYQGKSQYDNKKGRWR